MRGSRNNITMKQSTPKTTDRSYQKKMKIGAGREEVYQALTTQRGIAGWWTHLVDGAPSRRGKFAVSFEGMDQRIDLKVDHLLRPAEVDWTCLRHSAFPEWQGTRFAFRVAEISPDKSELSFSHQGLTPQLGCYQEIKGAWDYFLHSFVNYVERGRGQPFRK